jgi:hypothetical protein
MKRIIILLLAITPFLASAQVQIRTFQGKVTVHVNEAKIKADNSGLVDLEFTLCNLDVRSRQRLVLTPILFNGKDSLRLAPIMVNGDMRQHQYWRNIRLHGKDAEEAEAFTVLRNEGDKIITVPYLATAPAKPWLRRAGMVLEGKYITDTGRCELYVTDKLTNSIF